MDRVVGRSAGGQQADRGVDDRLFIDAVAQRAVVVAVPADRGEAVHRGAVSAWRSLVPGWTKAAPGMCRPIISIIIWLELAVP